MLEPTRRLIEMAAGHGVSFVFFADAGYLWQLKNHLHIPECKNDYGRVVSQLRELKDKGHEIALHVHPHWEDCRFEGGSWNMNVSRYKLSDFNEQEIEGIITKYHRTLMDITGTPCRSFRAGGWCIQPFAKIKGALQKNGIFTDSSVYRNGYHDFSAHTYDFRNAPDKTHWQFENDECMEQEGGRFTEVAITPDTLTPLFYISLYLKMKLHPEEYKPTGDGSWLKDKKRIYRQFYSRTRHFACADGYFASRLKPILLNLEAQKKYRMLVLGHPKSMARCSFSYLEEFIGFSKQKGYQFTTL